MPLKGGFGNLRNIFIRQMPGDRTSRSLDASLAIPTCVLRSKLPAPCDPKPVRLDLQTGQAGFGQTAMPGLRPRLCGSAEYPGDFLVNHRNPRELDVASANHHS
jgi:hypothetical protein